MSNSIKVVAVGDGCVGKTCMCISYAVNEFPREHVPTIFDNYSVTVSAGGKPTQLCLFDTAGQEEYDSLRVLSYPGADVFLVCFSIIEPASLENVADTWVREIKHHCGENVNFFVVGLKEDLRCDLATLKSLKKQKLKPVSKEQGERVAKKCGAKGYIECSALTQKGLQKVFNEAIMSVLEPELKDKKTYKKTKKSICKMIYSNFTSTTRCFKSDVTS